MGAAEIAILIASLIGTVVTAVGEYKTNEQNQDNFNKQLDFNHKEADVATKVQQAQAAGISPAAVAAANSGSGMFGSQASSPAAPQLSNPLGAIGGLTSQAISTLNTNQETHRSKSLLGIEYENAKANYQMTMETINGLQLDNKYKMMYNKYAPYQFIDEHEMNIAMRQLTYEQRKNVIETTNNIIYTRENIMPEEIKKIRSEYNVNDLNVQMMTEQIATMKLTQEQIEQEIELMKQAGMLNDINFDILDAEKVEAIARKNFVERNLQLYYDYLDSLFNQPQYANKLSQREYKLMPVRVIFQGATTAAAAYGVAKGVSRPGKGVASPVPAPDKSPFPETYY